MISDEIVSLLKKHSFFFVLASLLLILACVLITRIMEEKSEKAKESLSSPCRLDSDRALMAEGLTFSIFVAAVYVYAIISAVQCFDGSVWEFAYITWCFGVLFIFSISQATLYGTQLFIENEGVRVKALGKARMLRWSGILEIGLVKATWHKGWCRYIYFSSHELNDRERAAIGRGFFHFTQKDVVFARCPAYLHEAAEVIRSYNEHDAPLVWQNGDNVHFSSKIAYSQGQKPLDRMYAWAEISLVSQFVFAVLAYMHWHGETIGSDLFLIPFLFIGAIISFILIMRYHIALEKSKIY